MPFVDLNHIPLNEVNPKWSIEEIENTIYVHLTDLEVDQLNDLYVHVRTRDIPNHLRHLITTNDTFHVGEEEWEIVRKETFLKIDQLAQKVQFHFLAIPETYRRDLHWDEVVNEFKIIYIDLDFYQLLLHNFEWISLNRVPLNHRNKGEIIETYNLFVVRKSLLPTIFRKFNRQG